MPNTTDNFDIPYLDGTELVRDYPDFSEDLADAVEAGLLVPVSTARIANNAVTRAKLAGGLAAFTASTRITATDATFSVPALGSPIVKVTVIGAGGGGAGSNTTNSGGAGGATTFNAGGAGTVTAAGGLAGRGTRNAAGHAGRAGFGSDNGGFGGLSIFTGNISGFGESGSSGGITIAYLNMTGISTVNVTIGAGGAGGTGDRNGGTGGRGEVILEFVAA